MDAVLPAEEEEASGAGAEDEDGGDAPRQPHDETAPHRMDCKSTHIMVVTMSYRLVAKRTPATLRVQTNNLS